jgi:uncharacterized membrane protein
MGSIVAVTYFTCSVLKRIALWRTGGTHRNRIDPKKDGAG